MTSVRPLPTRRVWIILAAVGLFFAGWIALATGPDGEVSNSDGKPFTFRAQIGYPLSAGQSCDTVAREGHDVRVTAGVERTVTLGRGVLENGFCVYKFSVAGPFSGRSAVVHYDGADRRVVLRDGLSIGGVFLGGTA